MQSRNTSLVLQNSHPTRLLSGAGFLAYMSLPHNQRRPNKWNCLKCCRLQDAESSRRLHAYCIALSGRSGFFDQLMMEFRSQACSACLALILAVAGLATFWSGPRRQSTSLPEPQVSVQVVEFDSDPCCFPAIFSFGSSVADTGAGVLLRDDSPASQYPYGITFPGWPSGRWSNGRLLIDFWAMLFRLPYLDPFLQSGISSFRQGANFASGGCTAIKRQTSSVPITVDLPLQLYQFRKFKSQVLAANGDRDEKGSGSQEVKKDCDPVLPPKSVFGEALYMIGVGSNDIFYLVAKHTPLEELKSTISDLSDAIMRVVEGLYEEGARNILVEDVYPLGCMLVLIKDVNFTTYGELGDLDADGCVKLVDYLVLMHNSLLKKKIVAFAQTHCGDLSIALVDTYTIRRDLITNPVKYGFKYGAVACCGIDGIPGRYKSDEKCGISQRAQPCSDPSAYVMWDGLHFTEAANIVTMKAILSGEHFYPEFPLRCAESCSPSLADLARSSGVAMNLQGAV